MGCGHKIILREDMSYGRTCLIEGHLTEGHLTEGHLTEGHLTEGHSYGDISHGRTCLTGGHVLWSNIRRKYSSDCFVLREIVGI